MGSGSRRGLLVASAAAAVRPLPALAQAFGALLMADIEMWAGVIQIAGTKTL